MSSKNPRYQALFLGAGPQMQCGVGHFTRLLEQAIETLEPGSCTSLTLTRSEGTVADIWRSVGSGRNVVCNFPIVAWKRVILRPLVAMMMARLRNRRLILIQHEWASLNWMRRITYVPALLLANTIVMFSPLVRKELADDAIVGWLARKCVLAPLPPNIEAPTETVDSELRQRLTTARQSGRLIVGHFGSIYPGKQPNALLEIGALLKQRGLQPLIAYIGSFIRGTDTVEADFHARVAELCLTEDTLVSGYVDTDQEVFGLFKEVDVFCYPLNEGLTARRASILTSVQSGRPVMVTGPDLPDEFDHHPRFKQLIEQGSIVPVPRGASAEAWADMIASTVKRPSLDFTFDFDGWWRDVAIAVRGEFEAMD